MFVCVCVDVGGWACFMLGTCTVGGRVEEVMMTMSVDGGPLMLPPVCLSFIFYCDIRLFEVAAA